MKHADLKYKKVQLKKYSDFKDQIGTTKKLCVIFVGPPGCGKGTQSKILEDKTNLIHISTGEILRKSDDQKIKNQMETGKLLPDDIVANELDIFLKKNKKSDGFIFDGYPRNLEQKKLFKNICESNGIEIIGIFFLNVPEKKLRGIINKRGKTSGRSDDKDLEVFKIRMEEYNEKTLPMIDSMRNDINFTEIPNNLELEEISDKIEKILNKLVKFN